MVRICVNKHILFQDRIVGTQTLNLEVKDLSVNHTLSIELVDKTSNDTLVIDDKIVKDKSLKINKIYIDEVDIKKYLYQGKQIPVYHYEGQGPDVVTGDHLFFPGPWELNYRNPPRLFFANWSGLKQLINSKEKHKMKSDYLERLRNLLRMYQMHP